MCIWKKRGFSSSATPLTSYNGVLHLLVGQMGSTALEQHQIRLGPLDQCRIPLEIMCCGLTTGKKVAHCEPLFEPKWPIFEAFWNSFGETRQKKENLFCAA